MKRACKALNEKGKACKQQPLVGGEYCFWHDPAYEKQAAENLKKGLPPPERVFEKVNGDDRGR